MKIKKYGLGILYIIFIEAIMAGVLLWIVFEEWPELSIGLIYPIIIMMLLPIAIQFLVTPGLFTDSVILNDKAIRIITKKNISDIQWEEIDKIVAIKGGKTGSPTGWKIKTQTNEEYNIYPSGKQFIACARERLPESKIV